MDEREELTALVDRWGFDEVDGDCVASRYPGGDWVRYEDVRRLAIPPALKHVGWMHKNPNFRLRHIDEMAKDHSMEDWSRLYIVTNSNADDLRRLAAPKERWILVKDQLPNKVAKRHLITDGQFVKESAWHNFYADLWGFQEESDYFKVIGWQPLPPPPTSAEVPYWDRSENQKQPEISAPANPAPTAKEGES